MIYTAIDTFYLTDEQLRDSPSRKDGIDEATETALRVYGCDLIQESGILLKLYPSAPPPRSPHLFPPCSYAQVKSIIFACGGFLDAPKTTSSDGHSTSIRVAASCVWLAGKLEESPRRSKHIIIVFHRMECRRENVPIEHLDVFSKKYSDLKHDLVRTERHLLKEMGFICHVEHPHKFISNYLATLEAPELTQEAWNLANDSLRTTLCVRFKSEVVACGVVYAAARRHGVPLPEDPPWWNVFDADEAGIQEVCRVLAHLYSLPKSQYIQVYKDNDSFTHRRTSDTNASKESPATTVASDKGTPVPSSSSQEKDALIKAGSDKVKEKGDDDGKTLPSEPNGKEGPAVNLKSEKSESNVDRSRERERDRSRGRDRDSRGRDSDRDSKGRDSDRERERDREADRDRQRRHHSKDRSSGYSDKEKSRHRSSRDRGDHYSSHSSRDKDRHRRQ
uniref:Cyclin-like domain-containing protein n=2 Tax=Oryza TaxID=4527 RepID=A0A0D3ENY7_9ORYZ